MGNTGTLPGRPPPPKKNAQQPRRGHTNYFNYADAPAPSQAFPHQSRQRRRRQSNPIRTHTPNKKKKKLHIWVRPFTQIIDWSMCGCRRRRSRVDQSRLGPRRCRCGVLVFVLGRDGTDQTEPASIAFAQRNCDKCVHVCIICFQLISRTRSLGAAAQWMNPTPGRDAIIHTHRADNGRSPNVFRGAGSRDFDWK